MTLTHRIWLLLGLGLLSLTVVTSTYFWGQSKIEPAGYKSARASEMYTALKKSDSYLRMLVGFSDRFLLLRDPDLLTKAENVASKSLQGLDVLGDKTDEIRGYIDETLRNFIQLEISMKKAGLDETSGLKGELRNAVKTAEAKLDVIAKGPKSSVDPILVKMLMLRRHEKDFMLRKEEKYITKFSKRRTEFDQVLAASSLDMTDKKEILDLLDIYQAKFNTWAQTDLLITKQVTGFREATATALMHLEELEEAAEAERLQATNDMFAVEHSVERAVTVMMIVSIILLIGAGYMVQRSITTPVRRITRAMEAITDGDFSNPIPDVKTKDEVGALSKIAVVLRDNVKAQSEAQQREDDLRAEQESQRKRVLQTLVHELEASVGTAVGRLEQSMGTLSNSSTRLIDLSSSSATNLHATVQSSLSASSNVQTVAAASEELAASIGEIQRQANTSSIVVKEAADNANHARNQVGNLAQSAERIGDVVALIRDIAEQTNLLALNATIEAARAGELGKGFAVVAAEVKGLASQTARATEEISGQVSAIQTETRDAATRIEEIAGITDKVLDYTNAIATAVEEQGMATQEISHNVALAAQDTEEVSSNMGTVSENVNETSQHATDLGIVTEDISQQSSELSQAVEAFSKRVLSM
ncbi:methyl-accepting chemotaxis protein [Pseudovibrio sp. Tun.PSC04-5.I4]|uniref:methyl-accepting chemotaxis protein n=1 Tax=Pseudovibrio sp. Tun.PSC04-5.I4 TaxID=1798213 RepID=UPI00087ED656|nr:methyl-accepting chemotaxis protein [Pseudovibrio sp. Tun.PSC04-5.I4]SDQ20387.1 methyl-accepting chemotaxis sensory transducer [Pseudovibrio sp. Tun.PSC04-5.I4]